ncbi:MULTISPECIES: hypothetical protein [unclassified Thioalkalivibrio]|uniref:PilN domain-containing protein n=1 Tax=unclassified Thioalkalivibrio TaxID=2621013 RepID=UPI00035C97AF|nr:MULTISPECIES: hypothetical protein [unclassified Thioalkalivibrio]
MAQQINLYRAELDIRREVPIWGRLALAIGASILAGMLLWLGAHQQRLALQDTLSNAETQQARTEAQLGQLQALWEGPEVKQAEARVQQAEARAEALAAAGELLESRLNNARSVSMADPLLVLARTRHAGVWITAVRLDGRLPALELTGKALSPDALPPYFESLQQHGFGLDSQSPELEAQADNGQIEFRYRFGAAVETP